MDIVSATRSFLSSPPPDNQFDKAVKYLEETGLGLRTELDEAYLILNEDWLEKVLNNISKSDEALVTENLGRLHTIAFRSPMGLIRVAVNDLVSNVLTLYFTSVW